MLYWQNGLENFVREGLKSIPVSVILTEAQFFRYDSCPQMTFHSRLWA